MAHSLKEVRNLSGGRWRGIPIGHSGPGQDREPNPAKLTFLANPKYEKYLKTTQASAVSQTRSESAALAVIRVPDPIRHSPPAARSSTLRRILWPIGIHSSAVIGEGTMMGRNARIGALVVIGADCRSVMRCASIQHIHWRPGEPGRQEVVRSGVSIRSGVQIGRRVGDTDNASSVQTDSIRPQARAIRKDSQLGTVIIEDTLRSGRMHNRPRHPRRDAH